MNRKIFITLSLTWGALLSAAGGLVYAILRLLGHRPRRHGHALCFEIGYLWGGVDLGPIFIVNRGASEHTLDHELGHGYQNCILGPFFLVICVWSIARYHARRITKRLAPDRPLPPYDSIWFEGWATRLGRAAMGRDAA